LLADVEGRRRVVKGLIFTAEYSRHMFVYPTYRETPSLAGPRCPRIEGLSRLDPR
jgi:hypothetical protein